MNVYQPNAKIISFCQRLEKLDAGGKARLKRCAGLSLGEARQEAVGLFFSILPAGVPAHQEETYFLVATLFGLGKSGGRRNLGEALRKIKTDQNKKGLDRRMKILLDADTSQVGFRLRQAVVFLKAQQVAIDFQQLLDDLLWWGHEEHNVQRRWARSYFTENNLQA